MATVLFVIELSLYNKKYLNVHCRPFMNVLFELRVILILCSNKSQVLGEHSEYLIFNMKQVNNCLTVVAAITFFMISDINSDQSWLK